jgi:chromosome segregation protein
MHLDLTLLVKDIKYFKERLKKINVELKSAKDELNVYEPDLKQINQSLTFAKEKAEIADKDIEVLMQSLNEIIQEISKVELQKNSIQSKLQNDITTGNVEKKAAAYRDLISTCKFELKQAKEKFDKLKDEISTYDEVSTGLNNKRNALADINSKLAVKLAETRMQIKTIQDEIVFRNSIDHGPRTIMEYKKSLPGICGLVKDFITVEKKYERAILTALAKNVQSIIVEEVNDAKYAIDFLKKNKSGKATFLPLDTIKSREFKSELYKVLETVKGYIGIGVQLIQCSDKYINIFGFLLGNVIVCEDLDSAINASKFTYQLYRVVSLDGEIINVGGAIVGGYNRDTLVSTIDLPSKLEELTKEFNTIDEELSTNRNELDKVITELNEITTKQNEKKIMQSRYDETIKINENQLYKYEIDYDQLIKKHDLTDKSSQ